MDVYIYIYMGGVGPKHEFCRGYVRFLGLIVVGNRMGSMKHDIETGAPCKTTAARAA